MGWIEAIRLLVPADQTQQVALELDRMLTEIGTRAQEPLSARTFLNAGQAGDLVLIILWAAGPVQPRGSRTALSLASALKRFGLVHHSVWAESTNQDRPESTAEDEIFRSGPTMALKPRLGGRGR